MPLLPEVAGKSVQQMDDEITALRDSIGDEFAILHRQEYPDPQGVENGCVEAAIDFPNLNISILVRGDLGDYSLEDVYRMAYSAFLDTVNQRKNPGGP